MESIYHIFFSLLEPTGVIIILVVLLIFNSWIFKKIKSVRSEGSITRNTIALFIVLVGILSFILVLPINESLKGQILSFLGIIISAGIALSSTTVLGNLIAGIMNNVMSRFGIGDLVKIGDSIGRVTKKGIFHTELQLEDSNFITIPNLYIATNPVKLTRKTNTVISISVSLGYNESRIKIEECLKDAAIETGLKDPYVYVTSLGDYSVIYKIHGFLEDSNKYFSTRSHLNANVMDTLHERGIEIVSPTFMNQRRVDDHVFIPKKVLSEPDPIEENSPEDLIFDKAIKSEEIEKKKEFLKEIKDKREELKDNLNDLKGEEKEKAKASIKKFEMLEQRIERNIEEFEKKDAEE